MRKVTFGVANSLDNFIARENGAVDWLLWSDDVSEFITEFWETVDTVVMGRKTYDAAGREGMMSFPGVTNYVVSRTLTAPPHPNVQVVNGDAVEFVRKMKNEPGRDICIMGGGELAHALFEADLIDEVGVNIHPLLLGSGIPLFLNMSRQIELELFENRQFKSGCVMLRYRVVRR